MPIYDQEGLKIQLTLARFEDLREIPVSARADTGCTEALLLRRDVGEGWPEAGEGVGHDQIYLADGSSLPVDVFNAFVWLPGQDRPKKPIAVFRFRTVGEKQETLIGIKWLQQYEFCVHQGRRVRLYGIE